MAQADQAVEEKQDRQEPKKQAQDVELPDVAETDNAGQGTSIDVLLDLNVPITVIIDKTEIPVQRLLQLGPGSVVKLEKPVGAPVDLYLKDVKFATATIVVIDDRFAVRIKEILATGLQPDETNE